jgi:AraC-like DNA-binding protein
MFPQRVQLTDAASPETSPFLRWSQMFAAVFDVSASVDEIAAFSGDFVAYATPRFILSEARASSVRLIRSPETILGATGLDHFALRLFRAGDASGEAGLRKVEARAGDVAFFDLFQAFDLRLSAAAESPADVTLWIPRPKILAVVSNEAALHGLVLKAGSPSGALMGATLQCLAENVARMTRKEMDALADGVVALAAKAAAGALEQADGELGATALASFVTARRFIDRNLTASALNADMVAKAFGLSRATVYRLFEPAGGIANYVRKARLERAYQEITAPALSNRRIGQIAYGLGFKNVSAFNRLFLKTYGVSPSEARKGAAVSVARLAAGETPTLGYWLSRIG